MTTATMAASTAGFAPPARRHAWMAFGVSLLAAIVFLWLLPSSAAVNESSDYSIAYEPVARNLLAGRGFVDAQARVFLRYPPGYPLFLAGVFQAAQLTGIPEPAMLMLAGVLAMSVSALMVYLIAARLWGPGPAWIACLAWATYPLALYLLKQPNSELPFVVAMLGAVWCLVRALQFGDARRGSLVAAGALTGVAMLMRPIAIGLGLVLAFLVLLGVRRHRMLSAALLLMGNAVAIAPWEAWAYAKTGSVIALSSASPAALRDGLTFAVRAKGFREGVWVPAAVREVMQRVSDDYPKLVSVGAIASVLAREIRERPVGVAGLAVLKAARSWYGTDSQRMERLTLPLQALYLLILGAATVRAWRAGGVARRTAVAAWTIASYFWAMSIASTSLVRYMVPVMSVMFLLLPALAPATPASRVEAAR